MPVGPEWISFFSFSLPSLLLSRMQLRPKRKETKRGIRSLPFAAHPVCRLVAAPSQPPSLSSRRPVYGGREMSQYDVPLFAPPPRRHGCKVIVLAFLWRILPGRPLVTASSFLPAPPAQSGAARDGGGPSAACQGWGDERLDKTTRLPLALPWFFPFSFRFYNFLTLAHCCRCIVLIFLGPWVSGQKGFRRMWSFCGLSRLSFPFPQSFFFAGVSYFSLLTNFVRLFRKRGDRWTKLHREGYVDLYSVLCSLSTVSKF